MELVKYIKNRAYEEGFDLFGITKAIPHEDIKYYEKWIERGYNSEMEYLKKHTILKKNPNNILSSAKSILCFGASYNSDVPYSINDKNNKPRISRYALNYDYHDVLKNKLLKIIKDTKSKFDMKFDYRICIDSAPLLERSYSVKAGLGWIGKNGCLINKKFGSFIFLSEILVDFEIDTKIFNNKNTESNNSYCDNCTKCIDSCPTGAIVSDRVIDASKCLSYLMIENKNELPKGFEGKTNGFIFGCDICQEVCPWNKNIPLTRIKEFLPRKDILELDWEKCKTLTEEEFKKIFKQNPVKRTKYQGLMRNIKYYFENGVE